MNPNQPALQTSQEPKIAFSISDMYHLLAISMRLPTAELAQGIADGSFGEDSCKILQELGLPADEVAGLERRFSQMKHSETDVQTLLTGMRREYTRLFTHPVKPAIPIYETIFRYDPQKTDRGMLLFSSPTALDAEHCYKTAGVKLANNYKEPADHIAIEFEFLMYLFMQKGGALQAGDSEEANVRQNQINYFIDFHVAKWAGAFYQKILANSADEVYLTFAALGEGFLRLSIDRHAG